MTGSSDLGRFSPAPDARASGVIEPWLPDLEQTRLEQIGAQARERTINTAVRADVVSPAEIWHQHRHRLLPEVEHRGPGLVLDRRLQGVLNENEGTGATPPHPSTRRPEAPPPVIASTVPRPLITDRITGGDPNPSDIPPKPFPVSPRGIILITFIQSPATHCRSLRPQTCGSPVEQTGFSSYDHQQTSRPDTLRADSPLRDVCPRQSKSPRRYGRPSRPQDPRLLHGGQLVHAAGAHPAA